MKYEIRKLETGDYAVFREEELIVVTEREIDARVWVVNYSREFEKSRAVQS